MAHRLQVFKAICGGELLSIDDLQLSIPSPFFGEGSLEVCSVVNCDQPMSQCDTCKIKITLPLTEPEESFDEKFKTNGRDSPLDPWDVLAVLMRCQAGSRQNSPAPKQDVRVRKSGPGSLRENHPLTNGSDGTTNRDRRGGERISTRRKKNSPLCKFCKNNKEEKRVYEGHNLNDEYGRVACPILRQFICPLCGATGDNAHTLKYCPESDKVDHGTIMRVRLETEMANKRRKPPR
ncbi:hypothetical protein BaRGS_00039040 [Batillaria attramentaria]|uniref:Nanos-type domain-containing protein n=1 Tax=Batillaria attramentaria TaxID=370345 RepID=A0ABD0J4G0_9CAEN